MLTAKQSRWHGRRFVDRASAFICGYSEAMKFRTLPKKHSALGSALWQNRNYSGMLIGYRFAKMGWKIQQPR